MANKITTLNNFFESDDNDFNQEGTKNWRRKNFNRKHQKPLINMDELTRRVGHLEQPEMDEVMAAVRALVAIVDKYEERRLARIQSYYRCSKETVIMNSNPEGTPRQVKSEDGDGTKSISISLSELTGKYSKEKLSQLKGTRAKGSKKNPELYETYKARVSVKRSMIRALKFKETGKPVYTEKEVDEISQIWTDNYNAKFGTSFTLYKSKRRFGPARDKK